MCVTVRGTVARDEVRAAGSLRCRTVGRVSERTITAVEALTKVPLFAGLPAPELERLAAVRARRYRRGEVIFLEGDVGASLCVIAAGQVRIVLSGADGREVVLNVYGPGILRGVRIAGRRAALG